ncbi:MULTISPECIES: crotonase/enoyl-CoA hydratase family protein [Alteromonadaceae]|uniref:Crotonase/enoyl-CoA hydratase family protein n=1 Tax=Brumicola blandensis TaxID=3075611 RepID=A0AAW8R218_9ALTE|nr:MULTISPECIES: crotonase/enoyl-CoA hydratase family protein [unclassified Alteromonas]MDT0582130.1 crotonase/enoyl-CoA hydratase family protein [Alteromonas sp. W409]MDT0627914.1 crotonase/enoyl-CoA hydratase family protein [Alteromonas sp. W364]
MQYNTIEYTVKDLILTLSLNRPEQMNAFTVEMANELIHAFNRASDDDEVSAIVVTGNGRAFCAGMDLTREGNVFGLDESQQPSLDDMQQSDRLDGVSDTGGTVNLAIFECKKPVIAAINGAAVGVGATMLAAMDIRLASEKAKIGFVFEKIGITPEACSSWFLPRIVGISQALEWVYTGEIFDAETAKATGFVRSVHASDELLDAAYELAQKIANKSQVSITLARQMMQRLSAMPHPRDAHNIDSLAIFYASQTDGKEGVKSFLEKREPRFTSKSSTDMPSFYPWWDVK